MMNLEVKRYQALGIMGIFINKDSLGNSIQAWGHGERADLSGELVLLYYASSRKRLIAEYRVPYGG